jgi:hypothetical protein
MSSVITLSKVESATSKNGKPFLKITDTGDNWYSLWDTALFALAVQGATVEAEIEEKNGYKNLRNITRTLPTPNGSVSVGGAVPDDKRSRAIARQVALKAAVDSAVTMQLDTVAGVLDLAGQYFDWLTEADEDAPF